MQRTLQSKKELKQMILRIALILTLGCLLSCHTHPNEVNANGGGAYIVPIVKDSVPQDEASPYDRLPTGEEFEALFAYPHKVDDGKLIFNIDQQHLEIPLQGFSPIEGQVSLYHKLGSYLTSDGVLFQMDDKGNRHITRGDGYHSLRYVSDSLHEAYIPVGPIFWKKGNEGDDSKRVTYFNRDTLSLSYLSLYLVY